MGKEDDKNKKAILARRARFMAAALTATTSCDLLRPEPCLSVRPKTPDDVRGSDDQWADQRARAKGAEQTATEAVPDAGAPPALEEQIPAHRRGDAKKFREKEPSPRVCLSIQVIRGPPLPDDGGTPDPKKDGH